MNTVMTCSVCESIKTFFTRLFSKKDKKFNKSHHHEHHDHHDHHGHHHDQHYRRYYEKELQSVKRKYIDKYTCGICLDSNGKLIINRKKNYKIITPCGHIFHKQCLKKWLQTDHKKTCPICRTKIKHYKIFL